MSASDKAMVLGKATIRAAQALQLSNAALARVIGFSEPTLSRIAGGRRGIDPQSKEGQLALLVVRLFRSLDPLVGGRPCAVRFLYGSDASGSLRLNNHICIAKSD